MTSWLQAVPTLLVALAVITIPGASVAAVLRLRGLLAVAVVPAISISIISVSAIVAPLLGWRWAWWVPAIGTLVVLAALLVVSRFIRPLNAIRMSRARLVSQPQRQPATGPVDESRGRPAPVIELVEMPPSKCPSTGSGTALRRSLSLSKYPSTGSETMVDQGPWLIRDRGSGRREARVLAGALAGVIGAAIVISVRILLAARDPKQFTQNYDTVFHLNAVQHILNSGNGSSFFVSTFMRASEDPSFYPAAWHDLVSLIIQVTGASIPAATNVMWIVASGVIWPLACCLFTRVLFGARVWVIAAAGLLSAAFSASPYLLLYYGTAYPNGLSNTLVPIGMALVVLMVRAEPARLLPPVVGIVLAVLVVPGIALAQPNGLFTIACLLTPLLILILARWFARGFRLRFEAGLLRVAVFVLAVILVGALLFGNRIFVGLFRFSSPQSMPFVESLWRGLVNAPLPTTTPAWLLSALVVAGLFVAAKRFRQGWLVGSFLLALLLYAFATGSNDRLANALIAPWWGNPERVAALVPMLGVPLAALGMTAIASAILRNTRWPRAVPLLSGIVVVLIVVFSPTLRQMDAALIGVYAVPEKPDPLAQLDTDELALLHRLDDYVPRDAVIANNPWNGSALGMALANRRMLFPYSSMTGFDSDQWWLSIGLDHIATSAVVCEAARHKNVRYLLDFGMDFIEAQRYGVRQYPGIDKAAASGAFTLIASVGEAKLYKLLTCAE